MQVSCSFNTTPKHKLNFWSRNVISIPLVYIMTKFQSLIVVVKSVLMCGLKITFKNDYTSLSLEVHRTLHVLILQSCSKQRVKIRRCLWRAIVVDLNPFSKILEQNIFKPTGRRMFLSVHGGLYNLKVVGTYNFKKSLS